MIFDIVYTLAELQIIGICHRDLKLGNCIFLKEFMENEDENYFSNRIFLIDFGESDFKVVGEAKTNCLHGTTVYMSPEKLSLYN
jgi:serine/threonine protein kinase